MTPKSQAFDYSGAPVAVRADIAAAHRKAWEWLARPGTWWNGAERIAIAQEVRNARECVLCRERKAALSPFAPLPGEHLGDTSIAAPAVDAVHRLTTDPGRLSSDWVDSLESEGVTRAHYVELIGVVTAVVSIDTFHRALGLPLEPLPEPVAGAPSEYVPGGLDHRVGWVPMIYDVQPAETDLWGGGERTANVLRALSAVPDALRAWIALSNVHYLPIANIADRASESNRVLSRPQIELVAARVSAYNDCFY